MKDQNQILTQNKIVEFGEQEYRDHGTKTCYQTEQS
jgi:hypothetical protein